MYLVQKKTHFMVSDKPGMRFTMVNTPNTFAAMIFSSNISRQNFEVPFFYFTSM
jgi:hypothetical protein